MGDAERERFRLRFSSFLAAFEDLGVVWSRGLSTGRLPSASRTDELCPGPGRGRFEGDDALFEEAVLL
jgi:hypothetical protein